MGKDELLQGEREDVLHVPKVDELPSKELDKGIRKGQIAAKKKIWRVLTPYQVKPPVGLDDFKLKTGDYAQIEFRGRSVRTKLRIGQVQHKRMVNQGHLPELFQVAIDMPKERRRLEDVLHLPHERYEYLYDPLDGSFIFRIWDEEDYCNRVIRKATEQGLEIPKKSDIQTDWIFSTYRNKAEKKTIQYKKPSQGEK